jgi:hypothetical protein
MIVGAVAAGLTASEYVDAIHSSRPLRSAVEIILPGINLATPSRADDNLRTARTAFGTPRGLHFLRRIRRTTLKTCFALARPILAAALLLCVVSGALPAEAVLNPNGLMPCCRGMKGTAGERQGDSCPIHFGARQKPLRVVQHDPACGAERLPRAGAGTPVAPPQDDLEQSHSREQTQAEVEHHHGESVSPRNTPRQQPSAGVASLGKPCPLDCCGAASSLSGVRRPRQAAALTDNLRPRPPTVEAHKRSPSAQLKVASARRRSHPPRAPPAAPASPTA